jgi:cytochrome c oxidase subunit 2
MQLGLWSNPEGSSVGTTQNFSKWRKPAALGSALVLLLATTSCSAEVQRGWLPGERDTTDKTPLITDLWVNSWIAALIIGVITWGLMIWVIVAYRRRKNTVGFPAQMSYNLPLEVFYLSVPLMIVGVLFVFTDRDQRAIDARYPDQDVVIDVRGKQWSWDFNYVDEGVYETGVQANLDGEEGAEERIPTLYLPVDERVEFVLYARDVNHSFWIPAFLFKMDNIAGRENRFQVVPTKEGDFKGKCAELCGEYHSEMLFNVKVVSRDEYDDHIASLEQAGQTGELPTSLNRSGVIENDGRLGGTVRGTGEDNS